MKKRKTQGGGNRGINLRQSFGTGWYSNHYTQFMRLYNSCQGLDRYMRLEMLIETQWFAY